LGASGVTLLLQRLDAVQKRQGGLNGQRQGGLNDAPLIRTRRGLRGDAAQLLQAVMSHVSHYASPRALARTSHSQAFVNSSSNQQLGSSSDSRVVAARYLVAALMSSRTTPDSRASVGMPSQAWTQATMRRSFSSLSLVIQLIVILLPLKRQPQQLLNLSHCAGLIVESSATAPMAVSGAWHNGILVQPQQHVSM